MGVYLRTFQPLLLTCRELGPAFLPALLLLLLLPRLLCCFLLSHGCSSTISRAASLAANVFVIAAACSVISVARTPPALARSRALPPRALIFSSITASSFLIFSSRSFVMALIVVFLMYRFSAAMAAWLYCLHSGSASTSGHY